MTDPATPNNYSTMTDTPIPEWLATVLRYSPEPRGKEAVMFQWAGGEWWRVADVVAAAQRLASQHQEELKLTRDYADSEVADLQRQLETYREQNDTIIATGHELRDRAEAAEQRVKELEVQRNVAIARAEQLMKAAQPPPQIPIAGDTGRPEWLVTVPRYTTVADSAPTIQQTTDGPLMMVTDVIEAAQAYRDQMVKYAWSTEAERDAWHTNFLAEMERRKTAEAESYRHERGRQTLTEEVDRLMQEKEDLQAERDALWAQLRGAGYVPYLDRIKEIAQRAEAAERERDVMQRRAEAAERDCQASGRANRELVTAVRVAQAGRCRHCGHVEPHTGPAGDVADACTFPGCQCGYDSRGDTSKHASQLEGRRGLPNTPNQAGAEAAEPSGDEPPSTLPSGTNPPGPTATDPDSSRAGSQPDLTPLHALVAKWREAAGWEGESGSQEFGKGLDQCADEVEAVLKTLPVQPDLTALRAAVAAYDSNPYEQQWASPKEQAVLDAARALIESSHD